MAVVSGGFGVASALQARGLENSEIGLEENNQPHP